MSIGTMHTRIGFREAVAVICRACNVSQQLFHRLVKVFVVAVRDRQFVLAVWQPPGVELFKAVTFDVFGRALFAAHELAVVLDTQRQKNRGGLGIVASGLRLPRSRPRRFFVGSDLDAAMAKVSVQGAL